MKFSIQQIAIVTAAIGVGFVPLLYPVPIPFLTEIAFLAMLTGIILCAMRLWRFGLPLIALTLPFTVAYYVALLTPMRPSNQVQPLTVPLFARV
jgi:hypothetical protein